MAEGGFARRGRSVRGSGAAVVLVAAAVAVACSGMLAATADGGSRALQRLGSSATPAAQSRAHDPWRGFLAGESDCPGSARVDLSTARKIAAVTCLINFARSRRGLRPLVVHAVLSSASEAKAEMILRCRRFAHAPCGGDWTTAVRARGYSGTFGENLYLASGELGSPLAAVDAWLNSPPHRETLFRRGWKEQGVAVLANQTFEGYRDVSLWVSVLGA